MSCCICRLPFVPGPLSPSPRYPPEGIYSPNEYRYFQNGVAISSMFMYCILNVVYMDGNHFTTWHGASYSTIAWESDRGTLLIYHTTCAAFLRKVLDAEDSSLRSITDLCEIEHILGRGLRASQAGRIQDVNYEDVGPDKVDLRPFWSDGSELRCNNFDYRRLRSSDLTWTLSRPDVFPKFHITVSPQRLSSIGPPCDTTDVFTNLPLDIIETLLPYLSTPSYLALTSTCRLFRREALTAWQPHARKRVLDLGWAMPLAYEYKEAKKQTGIVLPHPKDTPHDADWLLYLSHVHRTRSMRARRWIYGLCEEVKRVFLEKKKDSKYAGIEDSEYGEQRSPARIDLELSVAMMIGLSSQPAKPPVPEYEVDLSLD